MIEQIYNQSADIDRLGVIGSSASASQSLSTSSSASPSASLSVSPSPSASNEDHLEYHRHLTGVPCHVQPSDARIVGDAEGDYGQGYLMICPLLDIVEGDRATIAGKVYRIMGVERLSFAPYTNDHLEIVIKAF